MRKAVPTWTNLPVSSTRQRIRSSRYTTYITNHNSARSLICKIDRDELLQVLVKSYLEL